MNHYLLKIFTLHVELELEYTFLEVSLLAIPISKGDLSIFVYLVPLFTTRGLVMPLVMMLSY